MSTTRSQPAHQHNMSSNHVNDVLATLRALRAGGVDDSTTNLALPPWARASIAPAITVARWGSVGFGIAFAARSAFEGSYLAVVAVAIALFITTWRTILPVRLASEDMRDRAGASVDVVLLGIATGITGGVESPFIFTVMVALGVIAFGWGYMAGMWGLLFAIAAVAGSVPFGPYLFETQADSQRDMAITFMSLAVVLLTGFIRQKLLEAEGRRGTLAGEIDSLNDANELLALVNTVARSLPSSLTLREALDACRRQIEDTFGARVIALVAYDEHSEEWIPRLADGCVLNPAYETYQLPPMFKEILSHSRPVLIDHDEEDDTLVMPVQHGMRSGLYARLEARSRVVGLLALEHPDPDKFEPRHLKLMSDMAEVLALTIDNARWFGRLRTLGAEEERVRLARDLHDRLGQWLTYIGFELERIISLDDSGDTDTAAAQPKASVSRSAAELEHLYTDVQSALDELRETLRQLRSGVTEEEPLAVLGPRLISGFTDRTGIEARFDARVSGERLPVPIENELYRILQEALNNINKHAGAESVTVIWTISGGNFELSIHDDGRGFAVARGVRESAYGLVGMRERADVIGAQLEIESKPGSGTSIRVGAGKIDTDAALVPDPHLHGQKAD